MGTRTFTVVASVAWLAAGTCALAASTDKAETKPTAASGQSKEAPPAKPVKAAGPRLEMAEHRGKNPGKDRDLRHCLDLGSAKEVIRCSEQK